MDTDTIDEYFKEHNFANFMYLGTLPADVHPKFSLKKLLKTEPKLRLGVIFNIDPSSKPGRHWVALFIDPSKPSIEYYDPTGQPPQGDNLKYLRKLKQENDTLKENKRYQFKVNLKENQDEMIKIDGKQYRDDLCAVYAIIFLIRRLKGHSFKRVTNFRPTDKKIVEFSHQLIK
jgi:hypothetical protein